MPSKPKPAKRIVDPRAGIEKVIREGRCRVCGERPGGTGTMDQLQRAHIVSRGQRGDDCDANIVPLCLDCHGALHDHRPGWAQVAARLRASLRPDEVAYVVNKKGLEWFDRYYPQ